MTDDITPKLYIPTSAEVPGGLDTSGYSDSLSVPMGTMVQPKKDVSVGGMQAGATTLTQGSGNDVFRISPQGIHLGGANFEDAPWRVDMQGNMVAQNVDFTGGTIGGFTITATSLYGGIIKTALNVGAGSTGVIMDTAGLRGYDSVLGETFNLPTNGSAPHFSSGVIHNTIFEIETSSIIRTSTSVGDGTASSAGILINNTGLYACESNQLLANANVKILINGSANFKGAITATSGTFAGITAATINVGTTGSIYGGQSAYNTGTGFWMGYDTSAYKFSIGNPSGSNLTWDGTTLTIVGSQSVSVIKTAKEGMPAGTPVGYTNVSGEVSRAVRMVGSSATNAPSFSNTPVIIDVISVDTNKYILLYFDAPGTSYLRVVAFSVDSSSLDLTFGSVVNISSNSGSYGGICKLDTNKFAAVYTNDGENLGKVQILTVSSLTITSQSTTTLTNDNEYTRGSCCQLDTDKFAWAFYASDTTNDEIGFCTVSTYTPTVVDYEEDTLSDSEIRSEYTQMTKVATDKFALFNPHSGYVTICTTASSTFVKGTGVDFFPVGSPGGTTEKGAILSISDNTIWVRTTGSVGVAYGTISGTTPTLVDNHVLGTDNCGDLFTNGTDVLEYFDYNTGTGATNGIYKLTLDGSTIVRTQIFKFSMGGTFGARATNIGSDYVIIGGVDTGAAIQYHIKGMSPGFIGITQAVVTAGNNVNVVISGLDSHQTSLIPGGFYEITNGILSLTVDETKAWKVQAENSTTVRI